MPTESSPGFNLFLDILLKLEEVDTPYAIIGGFAATIYGITRATFDIDIIVDLGEKDIQALAEAYPLPRYYADPHQMRNAMKIGGSFNIIDSTLGEKADLFPVTMDLRYKPAFDNRIRRRVEMLGRDPFSVWAARPEDVIIGKLMAWDEGRSERHPADIYEMMVFHYLGGDADLDFDIAYVRARAETIGDDTADLWQLINNAAQEEVSK